MDKVDTFELWGPKMSSKTGTGIKSYNELFASKKNIAFQAKFQHKLKTMTKEFYHRKESLNYKIKSTYQVMKDIQSSTGYSLAEVSLAE